MFLSISFNYVAKIGKSLKSLSSRRKKLANHSSLPQLAVLGNHPKIPELLISKKLDTIMTPVYFKNEQEMMKPGKYMAALIVNSDAKQIAEFISIQKYLKWIHCTTVGVDRFTSDKLKSSGIHLTNSKGAFSNSLAEFVLFSMLYFSKKTPYFNKQRSNKIWAPSEVNMASGKKVVSLDMEI